MSISRETIIRLMVNPNVKAFGHVVKEGETNHTDRAYSMVNGRLDMETLARHPWHGIPTTQGARACGAYQYLGTTWAEIADRYPKDCADFGVYAQDFGFVVKLFDRGAIDDVLAGDLYSAIRKCRKEWTSLPGAAENPSRYTFERAQVVFQQYGGGVVAGTQPAAPIEEKSVPYQPSEEKRMDPLTILGLFGPLIGKLIPQVMTLFTDPDDKKGVRNVAAAQLVIDTFTKAALPGVPEATGASVENVAAAVNAVQNSPVLKAEVTKAVLTEPTIMGLLEVGAGGIAGARAFATTAQNAEKPFWYNPTFWVTMAFFPMMYMIAMSILFTVAPDAKSTVEDVTKLAWYQQIGFDPNICTGALNLVLGFVFGGVVGVWFGTSWGSLRKTEISATGKDGM